MAQDFDSMENSNVSDNPNIHDVSLNERRTFLNMGFGAAATALFSSWLAGCATGTSASADAGTSADLGADATSQLGFKSIPISAEDKLRVPAGYTAQPFAMWGEPVGLPGNMPAWRDDASNTAAEQAAQLGQHHDGMHYYAFNGSSAHGLLAINHEYTDDGLLHPDGMKTWTADKVKKAQNSHGLAVIEVKLNTGQWQVVRPSPFARRFTMDTPFAIGGPAAGHPLMRTAADPQGKTILGTLGNCAAGKTPWGTYLSGEENWAGYFAGGDSISKDQGRWGLNKGAWYRWAEHDDRFDARKNPNEFHRFGWIVEMDPMDPTSNPVKRTALGRAAHEGAWVGVTQDGRAVVYSGEDARFEYIYKFVSRDRIAPAGGGKTQAQNNRDLLDHGVLHVARFDADGRGAWLPLVHGQGPLTPANGFADQAEVVIKARQASDLLGATKMDRSEWLAIDPHSGWVYCTLTNNSQRGQANRPGVNAANPRANNTMGHIIRWKDDADFDGRNFIWNHLVLCGDPANIRDEAKGNIRGDLFACPDTIAFDGRGLLWIGCDISPTSLNKGEMVSMGNNQLLACDVASGEVRRFLTGPVGCELTACTFTPDGTTMFTNVQHPGETPSERADPAQPRRFSNWPEYKPNGRPRSAVVAVRRGDGGVVGS